MFVFVFVARILGRMSRWVMSAIIIASPLDSTMSCSFLIYFILLIYYFGADTCLSTMRTFFFLEVTDVSLTIIHCQSSHAEDVSADTQVRHLTHTCPIYL